MRQEISNIIQDLKRVERQLLVIDMMVDPDGTLDALSSLGLPSPLCEQQTSPGPQHGTLGLKEPGTSSGLSGTEPSGPSNKSEEGQQLGS